MKLKAKIAYIKEPRTGQGRLGEYEMQGVRLEWTEEGVRNSIYGSFFESNLEAFRALNPAAGDTIGVDLSFAVVERDGYLKTLVTFQNPHKEERI